MAGKNTRHPARWMRFLDRASRFLDYRGKTVEFGEIALMTIDAIKRRRARSFEPVEGEQGEFKGSGARGKGMTLVVESKSKQPRKRKK